MVVGKQFPLDGYYRSAELERLGTAIGSLGRYNQATSDGMPVFNARGEVLLKVSPELQWLVLPDYTDLDIWQVIYISQLTQTITFGFTKAAVILFYRRLLAWPTHSKELY